MGVTEEAGIHKDALRSICKGRTMAGPGLSFIDDVSRVQDLTELIHQTNPD